MKKTYGFTIGWDKMIMIADCETLILPCTDSRGWFPATLPW